LLEDLTETHLVSDNWPQPPTYAENRGIVARAPAFMPPGGTTTALAARSHLGRPGRSANRQFAEIFERFAEREGDQLSAERRRLYHRLIDAGPASTRAITRTAT